MEAKIINLQIKTREKIKSDPWILAKILYPKYKFKDFHRKWFENNIKSEEDLCLGPRNFAKTTVRGIIGTIWDMIRNPNIQLGIVSDTNPQAIHFAAEIKMHCERNRDLLSLYPYLSPGKIWTEKEFTISGATEIQKGATVTAFGYGQGTGYEFDKLRIDDIVDWQNSRTKFQREKLYDWIRMSLIPMLKSGGETSWNGTRYHQDDLYGKLLERGIKTNTTTHKAIMDNGESMWPELWPVEKLKKIKEKIGSLRFDAQYQNDTKLMAAGKIFKREYFQYFYKTEQGGYITSTGKRFDISDLQIFQTCDLATSQKTTADYFAILTFGIDREGNFYIFDVYRARISPTKQEELLVNNYIRWHALRIGIEATQYQIMLQQQVDKRINVGARAIYPHKDKVTRSIPMQTKYENFKVFHFNKMPILTDFEDELTTFNEGEHDDMVDCVSMMPDITEAKKTKIYVNI